MDHQEVALRHLLPPVVGFVCALLGQSIPRLARAEAAFPTEVRLTTEECRLINERGTLRGRSVRAKTSEVGDQWRGERVFTGAKSDVIGWFSVASQREFRVHLSGARATSGAYFGTRCYQYDILCDRLIATGDRDVVLAVLWNYVNSPMGYLAQAWKQLAEDTQLTPADRLVAWIRWRRVRRVFGDPEQTRARHQASVEQCWSTLGAELQPADFVRAVLDMRTLNGAEGHAWWLFNDAHLTEARARRILLPIVRREYLREAKLVSDVIRNVCRVPALRREVLERLMRFDAERDRRSAAAWDTLDARGLDAATVRRLRAFALEAQLWDVGGQAFWTYLATAAGRKEIAKDGAKAYIDEYLAVAFRKERDSDKQRFVYGLVATPRGRARLAKLLEQHKVDITVTKAQYAIVERAWKRKAPKAFPFVVARD